MLSLFVLAFAVNQTEEAVPEPRCPVISLAAQSARVVSLVGSDLTAWRGPVIELQLASTAEETQNFGALSLIRLSGKVYASGMLGRRLGDGEKYSFVLSFEPEQLAALAAATELELAATDGTTLVVPLTPADPAALKTCLDDHQAQVAPPGDPVTRRSYTFQPLEPNQPLRLRYRGDPGHFYPTSALQEERGGTSRIAITIGKSGRITECNVIASSGHQDLDAASCRAARASAFLPETNGLGEPVETKREQQLNWVIAK